MNDAIHLERLLGWFMNCLDLLSKQDLTLSVWLELKKIDPFETIQRWKAFGA